MRENLTIQNVVEAEKVVITTYPQWSDYGSLTMACRVITKEDNGYKEQTYVIDEIEDGEKAYCLNLNMLSDEEIAKYQEYKRQSRIDESQKSGSSFNAKIGDTVKVYKGKKNMGLEIIVKSEYDFVDRYGRTQASYWLDENGIKVNKFNSIIIK